MKYKDLVGTVFGRLTVIEKLSERKNGKVVWLCRCQCGKIKKLTTGDMTSGRVVSCGCYHRDVTIATKRKYHLKDEEQRKLYGVWKGIKERCYCKTNKSYEYYGKRGICVCDEWLNDFNTFMKWALKNGYKQGLSIDRIDNNGDYSPDNCRWATTYQQANNRKMCKYITIDGETKTIAEWSRKLSVSYSMVRKRIKKGWDAIEALTTPAKKNNKYVINGMSKTIVEWCKYYSINKKIVWDRLKLGWDIERALTEPILVDRQRYVTIGNETKPIREWFKIYSIKYDNFYQRLQNGWDVVKAITTPIDLSKLRVK